MTDLLEDTFVKPAYVNQPPAYSSLLPKVRKVCELLGETLEPEQEYAIEVLTGRRADGRPASLSAAVICARQNLKALDISTPLLTSRGWVTMGTVQPGDEVYHPAGHLTRVVGVSPIRIGHMCYRVTTTDGRSVIADAGHLWTVIDKRHSTGGRRTPRSFVTKTITTAEMLEMGLSRLVTGGRTSVAAGKAYATNEYRFALPTQEPLKSPDVDLPIDPYLFGVWLGDGTSIRSEMTVGSKDLEHVVAEVAKVAIVTRTKQDPRTGAWGVWFKLDARMREGFESQIRRLGVYANKHVPDIYLAAGTHQREALLQGLMDSDGMIESQRSQASFTSTRKPLAEAVLYLARSLGWRAAMQEGRAILNGKDVGSKWFVSFTSKQSDPFVPFRLPRKVARIQPLDGGKGRSTVSIARIEQVESVPVRCIKVESPDGLFLAGRDLIATHNTYCLERIVLTLMLEPNSSVKLILWTSQQLTTCDETFDHFVHWFAGRDPKTDKLLYPFLAKRLDPEAVGDGIDRGKGTKKIVLKGNRRLLFKARSPKSGQGLSGDVVVLDEAFAVEPEHTAALVPTLSTRPQAMLLYGSSAGHEESESLRIVRDLGRKGGKGAPAYVEWCAPGSFDEPGCAEPGCQHLINFPGCALDNKENIRAANPMAGRRITWEYLENERYILQPPEKFARERLGWWDNALSDLQPISVEAWEALIWDVDRNGPPPSGDPCFFVDCSPNLRSASIAGATSQFGRPYVKMAAYRTGTDWLPAAVEELRVKYPRAKWMFESNSPFSALADHNEALKRWEFGADEDGKWPGIVVETPFTANDMARGCGHLQKLVNDELMAHSGDPVVIAALRSAIKRDMGDPGLWSWGRKKSGGDISPLVSTTGALWLLESQPNNTFFFSKR